MHSHFDAKKEMVECEPIWVRLPGFPIQYWNESIVSMVGNRLGKYLEVEISFKQAGIKTVAKILVSLDLRKGLGEDIEIETCCGYNNSPLVSPLLWDK